jgi:uncharacterized protein (DUF58 family)
MPTLPPLDPLTERQFTLAVKRLADSLSYGSDSSPFLGSGIEYVQSRLYQPGDSIKSMDWRITARTGKPHVKEYEAPKQTPVWLVVDTSGSMMQSSQRLSKYAQAVQIAGGIALAALQRVSPVGVISAGEQQLHIPPSLSRAQLFLWLHQLRHFQLYEHTHLGKHLRQLTPQLKNKCLLVIVSDFHDPDGLPALKLLAQKHDAMAIQLQDPAEAMPLRAGIFRGEEAETGRRFVARGRDTATDQAAVAAEFRRSGVDHLVLPTDQPIIPALRGFLQQRGVLGKGKR